MELQQNMSTMSDQKISVFQSKKQMQHQERLNQLIQNRVNFLQLEEKLSQKRANQRQREVENLKNLRTFRDQHKLDLQQQKLNRQLSLQQQKFQLTQKKEEKSLQQKIREESQLMKLKEIQQIKKQKEEMLIKAKETLEEKNQRLKHQGQIIKLEKKKSQEICQNFWMNKQYRVKLTKEQQIDKNHQLKQCKSLQFNDLKNQKSEKLQLLNDTKQAENELTFTFNHVLDLAPEEFLQRQSEQSIFQPKKFKQSQNVYIDMLSPQLKKYQSLRVSDSRSQA